MGKKKSTNCDPIYAFHGTKPNVIDDILKTNFDMQFAQRQAYGKGHYFSEYPEESLKYGPGLIFCELLTGKEYKGTEFEWKKYGNSKVVLPAAGTGHSQMIIIQESAQILPVCVIHLEQ